ncbi:expressed unknown protein [Seminavis robusta]|uniref:Uncharacterized protein n=1 Tax=Seminavis robusta TaxID=568900 RepID=A0A9N8H9I0_9STRA|nr:expressed unknown protein [Seminavis robusta]|eukprot:Sro276_g106090.1 n/a (189) ;mRNA; r:67249-67999
MKISTVFACLLAISGHAHAAGIRSLQDCPPVGTGVACTADINPVECGDLKCKYDNDCLANSAGFAATQCNPVSQCPPVGTGVACTADINPVECGDMKCRYDNDCLANSAGFAATQCNAPPVPCNPTTTNDCSTPPTTPPPPPCNPTTTGDCATAADTGTPAPLENSAAENAAMFGGWTAGALMMMYMM